MNESIIDLVSARTPIAPPVYRVRLQGGELDGCYLRSVWPGYVLDPVEGSDAAPRRVDVLAMSRDYATATRLLQALGNLGLTNNGWTEIGKDPQVAAELQRAGFTVLWSTSAWNTPVLRAYTPEAQEALRGDAAAGRPFSISTYSAPSQQMEEPDLEAAILDRQERYNRDL